MKQLHLFRIVFPRPTDPIPPLCISPVHHYTFCSHFPPQIPLPPLSSVLFMLHLYLFQFAYSCLFYKLTFNFLLQFLLFFLLESRFFLRYLLLFSFLLSYSSSFSSDSFSSFPSSSSPTTSPTCYYDSCRSLCSYACWNRLLRSNLRSINANVALSRFMFAQRRHLASHALGRSVGRSGIGGFASPRIRRSWLMPFTADCCIWINPRIALIDSFVRKTTTG